MEHHELINLLTSTSDLELEPTSTTEVNRLIKKMKGKKSAGCDQMIKMLPPSYVECLVKCFNCWLSECRYSDLWTIAKVITLNKLKAGIPRCEQTRPISLLSTHSKLFEKILLDRAHLWASIYQEIKNNLATNAPTLAIYVDYEKAYDRVWYIGLMVKLYKLGIPLNLLKMIESWLDKRTAFISFGQRKSVAQIFYSQVKKPMVSVSMLGQKLEIVDSLKYLGFTWTNKLSLKPTVNNCLENIQKSLNKLKWLRSGRALGKEVLRRCFFSYTFPYIAWVFPFFPLLPLHSKIRSIVNTM
jgi:hypothetical protein